MGIQNSVWSHKLNWSFLCRQSFLSYCFSITESAAEINCQTKAKTPRRSINITQNHLLHVTAISHPVRLKVPGQVSMDLPNNCKQAWMSSSQLAPFVRCPRAIIDLPGVVWVGLGLWNLWGRPGGETLDLELHPGVTLLKKTQHK